MVDPRAASEDLTGKARIRNAALDLYAQYGEDRVSLRAIAAEAGVTLGLVQHHYKSKAGLRAAVDQLVADYFAGALAEVPPQSTSAENAAARDDAVRKMLQDNPPVVNYVRRTLLEPSKSPMHLLDVLVELTRGEVGSLRQARLASTTRRESTQIISVLVSQMGEQLLQPLVDAVWDRVAGPDDTGQPRLSITVTD